MKLKILKTVRDEKTGQIYQPGEVIELNKTRSERAIKNKYAKEVVEKKKENKGNK